MKTSPIMSQTCQNKLSISSELNFQKFTQRLNFLPKWRNLAKSGHTGHAPPQNMHQNVDVIY